MFSFKGDDDFAPIPPPNLNSIIMPKSTFSGSVFGVLDLIFGLLKILLLMLLLAVPISAFLWANAYEKRFGRPPTLQDWVQGWRDTVAQNPSQLWENLKEEIRNKRTTHP